MSIVLLEKYNSLSSALGNMLWFYVVPRKCQFSYFSPLLWTYLLINSPLLWSLDIHSDLPQFKLIIQAFN